MLLNPFKIAVFFILAGILPVHPVNAVTHQANNQYAIYMSPKGSDSGDGSVAKPFKSFNRAKQAVQAIKAKVANVSGAGITVWLRDGNYFLDSAINFTPADGGNANLKVTYKAFEGENPVINGGYSLKSEWVKQDGNIWSAKLPDMFKANRPRQLFLNGTRLQRSTSPYLRTNGLPPEYKKLLVQHKSDWGYLRQNNVAIFCIFRYNGSDMEGIGTDEGAEAIVYNSFEATWQEIGTIDKAHKLANMKSPARYPVGYFSDSLAYRIENTKKYLDKPGEWRYQPTTNQLFYMAKANEDPNGMQFIIPKLGSLINIDNGNSSNSFVTNLAFEGLKFRYNVYPMGITWHNDKLINSFTKNYPQLDLNTGFTSMQGAPLSGAAVNMQGAHNCEFTNCEFSRLGNYAIQMGAYCVGNKINGSAFADLGAGGIMMGFAKYDVTDSDVISAVSHNVINNCKFHDLGKVHPAGIPILIMQSHDNMISNNEIYNIPYSGISTGWTWGKKENLTYNNTIVSNTIHDAMQLLTDGGGIYTIGPQKNTIIKDNTIYNIRYKYKSPVAFYGRLGRSNSVLTTAIFFDNSSAGIKLDGNNIYNVGTEKPLRFNTDSTLMIWGRNSIRK